MVAVEQLQQKADGSADGYRVLKKNYDDLKRLSRYFVGRELEMKKLKEELDSLKPNPQRPCRQ